MLILLPLLYKYLLLLSLFLFETFIYNLLRRPRKRELSTGSLSKDQQQPGIELELETGTQKSPMLVAGTHLFESSLLHFRVCIGGKLVSRAAAIPQNQVISCGKQAAYFQVKCLFFIFFFFFSSPLLFFFYSILLCLYCSLSLLFFFLL